MTTSRRQPFNHNMEVFGLIAWLEETRIVLPLKAVDVAFDVNGDLAEVSLEQVFHQTSSRPLDVTYSFPLPAGAAVFRCELIVNDRVIQARVEEQAEAQKIAREMKAAGRRVGLVEVERENLFTLSLGNVQPDDLIIVRFAWFQALDHAQRAMSLAVPFTPGLRYIPGEPLLRSNRGKGTADDTNEVPDASRISPPRIDALHPDAALISLRGKLDARFVEIDSVTSSTHPVIVRTDGQALEIKLPMAGHVPDRDFVLTWNERVVDSLDLKSVSCVDDEFRYAVVRLDAPAQVTAAAQQNCDYYFLVDRSGSMAGKKWECTARALNAFVDELGASDRVWVTLFESSFQDYAEAPLPVAELRDDPPFRQLERLGTGGGTELRPALEHVLGKIARHSKEREPVIVVITDGQVGNERAVVELLRDHRGVPVHTFGIDSAVNDAFLKQLATQHRGACMLMTPNDDIPGAVRRLGNRLRRPVLTKLTVAAPWETTCEFLPDIHVGEHVVVAVKGPKSAEVIALTGWSGEQAELTYRFELHDAPVAGPRLLWVRQAMDRCLAEERHKDAVALAIRHNIVCQGAAFIAYDLQEKVTIAKQEIYQPAMESVLCSLADTRSLGHVAAAPACAAPPSDERGMMRRRVARNVAPGSSSPAAGSITSSIKEFLGEAKSLFAGTRDTAPKEPAGAARLREIQARYYRNLERPGMRAEILNKAWREKVLKLPVFQTEMARALVDLLCFWAAKDPVKRFRLLDPLAEAGSAASIRAQVQDVIKNHVTEPELAKDLLWLAAQVN